MKPPPWLRITTGEVTSSSLQVQVSIDWTHPDALPAVIALLRHRGQDDIIPLLTIWHRGFLAGYNARRNVH